eukprot:scaffold1308_cov93-Cylindrotheca_fusiformis.AAC.4
MGMNQTEFVKNTVATDRSALGRVRATKDHIIALTPESEDLRLEEPRILAIQDDPVMARLGTVSTCDSEEQE